MRLAGSTRRSGSRLPLADVEAGLGGTTDKAHPGWVRHEDTDAGDTLNRATVDPFMVAFAEQVLVRKEIALSHGAVVGKDTRQRNPDRELHARFSNDMPAYPTPEARCTDLPMTVYHTDVANDLDRALVASAEPARDLPPQGARVGSREDSPELGAADKHADLPRRVSQFSTPRVPLAVGRRWMRRIATASPSSSGSPPWGQSRREQAPPQGTGGRRDGSLRDDGFASGRALVGLAPPGHEYRNEKSRAGVAARCTGKEMGPYE